MNIDSDDGSLFADSEEEFADSDSESDDDINDTSLTFEELPQNFD